MCHLHSTHMFEWKMAIIGNNGSYSELNQMCIEYGWGSVRKLAAIEVLISKERCFLFDEARRRSLLQAAKIGATNTRNN